MRIKRGLAEHPEQARGLSLRRMLRRMLYGPAFSAPGGGRHRLEDLANAEAGVALEFQPKLRQDARIDGAALRIEPFEIALDEFELEVLARCNGALSAGEIAILAANAVRDGRPDDPVGRTLTLLGTLAEFNGLEPWERPR